MKPVLFSKLLDCDWIVYPFWKVDLDLDWQSHICEGFGLDWQSKKIGLSNSLLSMLKYVTPIYQVCCYAYFTRSPGITFKRGLKNFIDRSIVMSIDLPANEELLCNYGYLETFVKLENIIQGIVTLGKWMNNNDLNKFQKNMKDGIQLVRSFTKALSGDLWNVS